MLQQRQVRDGLAAFDGTNRVTASTSSDDLLVESHHRGFPTWALGRRVADIRHLQLVGADMATPLLTINEAALTHNIAAMQRFCDDAGFWLAPHAKTSMAPGVIRRQLEAGAWGITVASAAQARTLAAYGVRRLLIANEIVDSPSVSWLGEQLDADPSFEAFCYVDSTDGVHLLDATLRARGQRRRLPVFVEFGVAGGRAGIRNEAAVAELAKDVVRTPTLRLAGVAGFEGLAGTGMGTERLDEVRKYLLRLRACGEALAALLAPPSDRLLVTAGGSAFFDLFAEVFDPKWCMDNRATVVLRSGCYVTHDSGVYEAFRLLVATAVEPVALRPAITLWGRVLSQPEAGLAIVDVGRRDVGLDAGPPRLEVRLGVDGQPRELPRDIEIADTNDQHTHVRFLGEHALDIGDVCGFGVSHPCTTLDRWRLIPFVDETGHMLDATDTLF